MKKTLCILILLFATAVQFSCKKEYIHLKPEDLPDLSVGRDGNRPSRGETGSATFVIITKDLEGEFDNRAIAASSSFPLHGVPLSRFYFTSHGSSPGLSKLQVTLKIFNTGTAGMENATALTKTLRLYNSFGQQLDSQEVPANGIVTFQGFTHYIPDGSTTALIVKADINPLDGVTLTEGCTVYVTITPENEKNSSAYDENGKAAKVTYTGYRESSNVSFYTTMATVLQQEVPLNYYAEPAGLEKHGLHTMSIPFSISAQGKDYYIPSIVKVLSDGTGIWAADFAESAIQCSIDDGKSLQKETIVSAVVVYSGSGTLTVTPNGNYKIPKGNVYAFKVVVQFRPIAQGSYRASIVNINLNNDDSGSRYFPTNRVHLGNKFITDYVSGQ
ncbi:MAG: hypothetical protein V4478_03520 [Patescibacteria group bacterium]